MKKSKDCNDYAKTNTITNADVKRDVLRIAKLDRQIDALISNKMPVLYLEKPSFDDVASTQTRLGVNLPCDYLWFMRNGIYFDADEFKMLTSLQAVTTETLKCRQETDVALLPEYIALTELNDEAVLVLNTISDKVYFWEPFEDGDYIICQEGANDYLDYMIENLADLCHELSGGIYGNNNIE